MAVALASVLRTPMSGVQSFYHIVYFMFMQGFRVLVEREWLEFGHKFADRCGIGQCSEDTNERCPVFLQFLDCVHQLLNQFPLAFQFNEAYLVSNLQKFEQNCCIKSLNLIQVKSNPSTVLILILRNICIRIKFYNYGRIRLTAVSPFKSNHPPFVTSKGCYNSFRYNCCHCNSF